MARFDERQLGLARMPRDTRYAVFEMGMNNSGEIAALTRQVRPDVALVTAIAPAHIENLGSEEAIADAKGEIFQGLEEDGVAIVPNDTPHRDRLVKAARRTVAARSTGASLASSRSVREHVRGREPPSASLPARHAAPGRPAPAAVGIRARGRGRHLCAWRAA